MKNNKIEAVKNAISSYLYVYTNDSRRDVVIAKSAKDFFEDNKCLKVFRKLPQSTYAQIKQLLEV